VCCDQHHGYVLRGTVYLSHGWGLYSRDPKDTSGNLHGTAAAWLLSDDDGDEFTGMPFYSGVPCKVEKIKADAHRPKKNEVKKKSKPKTVTERRKEEAGKAKKKAPVKTQKRVA